MRLFFRVVASVLCGGAFSITASHAETVAGIPFGAPYPGSRVSSTEPTSDCGERYKFVSTAPLASVAKFFLSAGSGAGLTLLSDTDAGDTGYRMITFVRPHGHRVLFVTLTKTDNVISGTVYIDPAPQRQCRLQ